MDPSSLASLSRIAVPATYVVAGALIVAERVALHAMRRPRRARQALASLASGAMAFGLLAIASRLLFVHVMTRAWSLRAVDLGAGILAWLAAFVVYDFMFWFAHVAGHRVRVLWCFHSVHHTATEMRLTTAVRGSAFDFVYLPWFFVWIPALGVHPAMLLVVESLSRMWGVATHVSPSIVGRLGALDRALVTPSVHRVHHGTELAYLDTNYGEVLLLWDRLFGTYAPEREAPTYGVLKPVDPCDVAEVQLSPWRDLWRDLRRAPTLSARLRYLFDAPGWSHDGEDLRVTTLRRRALYSPTAAGDPPAPPCP
ncbi:MAG: sterol desaturase family protein [Polyangiales bacterium]